MNKVGIVIYCQGFILPYPFGYVVREMGLCDISGKHYDVHAYELPDTVPSYSKLSPSYQKQVDARTAQHGVSYESKYPARSKCLTSDLETFLDRYAPKDRPSIGVWAKDVVARTFMEGIGIEHHIIEHGDLQDCPLSVGIPDDRRYQLDSTKCAGHGARQGYQIDLDDMDKYDHRCSLEFACALSGLVRYRSQYRSPTLLEDLNYQRLLWQHRLERVLDTVMCEDCAIDMSTAYERGEGLTWYSDCDTGHCHMINRILHYGVHQQHSDYWGLAHYKDNTLDTLCTITPYQKPPKN